MKTEPGAYSIDDLQRDGKTHWDGVRNYQARNLMRDDMKVGDQVLIYHSSTDPVGVVGVARMCKQAYPDHTALDRKDKHYDPKATKDNPIWLMVDIEFVERLPRVVTLTEMKQAKALDGMLVTKRGQRLSIQPVEQKHFDAVLKLARRKT